MNDLKGFESFINTLNKNELKEELKKLYESLEQVKVHYSAINAGSDKLDRKLLEKHEEQITKAIYPNKYMQGGLDTDKVENILKPFRSNSTIKYYLELGLFAVEECTNIANEFGGDFGEDFFIYFEELFEDIVQRISRGNLEEKYKIRLIDMTNSAFDGYGHYDQLKDVFSEYF